MYIKTGLISLDKNQTINMKTEQAIEVSDSTQVSHSLSFATSQEFWCCINEMFLSTDDRLFGHNGLIYSGTLQVFNMFIKIRKAWVDPEFNYGRMFNYTPQKWASLLGNYLDLNKLDLLRSNIRFNQHKKVANYNLSYLFNNTHTNGKGCLLSATFSKRPDEDIPNITLVIRSSEITKRLIFDLLLIERMGQYVYGKNVTFGLNLFITQMYCNTETLLMYNTYKPVKKIIKKSKSEIWVKSSKETFNKFFSNPESFRKYKVFLRSARCINPEAFNHVFKNVYAKDLDIVGAGYDIEYPENCITATQRKRYLKTLDIKQIKAI